MGRGNVLILEKLQKLLQQKHTGIFSVAASWLCKIFILEAHLHIDPQLHATSSFSNPLLKVFWMYVWRTCPMSQRKLVTEPRVKTSHSFCYSEYHFSSLLELLFLNSLGVLHKRAHRNLPISITELHLSICLCLLWHPHNWRIWVTRLFL